MALPSQISSPVSPGKVEKMLSTEQLGQLKTHTATVLDTDSMYSLSISDQLFEESGSISMGEASSTSVELHAIKSKIATVNEELDMLAAKEDNVADVRIEDFELSVSTNSVCIQWRWPWSTLYDTKRKSEYFYNEVTRAIQLDCPLVELDDKGAKSSAKDIDDFQREFILRSPQFSSLKLGHADVYSTYKSLFGHKSPLPNDESIINKSTVTASVNVERVSGDILQLNTDIKLQGDEISVGTRRLGREEVQALVQHFDKFTSTIVVRDGNFQSPLRLPRPTTSPAHSSALYRPMSAATAVSISQFSPSRITQSPFISSSVGSTSVRSLLIGLFELLNEVESTSLRDQICNEHFLTAIRHQRAALQVPPVGAGSSAKAAVGRNTLRVNMHAMFSSVAESSCDQLTRASQSIEEMISQSTATKLQTEGLPFEQAMTALEYAEYSNCVKEAHLQPESVECKLRLLGHLVKCGAHVAATVYLSKLHDQAKMMKLYDSDAAYIALLNIKCRARYLAEYSKINVLYDLSKKLPEDSYFLGFVADELSGLQSLEDAELYYMGSLVQDPSNGSALMGYARLLASKGDHSSAIKYYSRVQSPASVNTQILSKLEAAWCSELAGAPVEVTLQLYRSASQTTASKKIQSLVYSCTGNLYFRKGERDRAVQLLMKSTNLDCGNLHACTILPCLLSTLASSEYNNMRYLYFSKAIKLLPRRCSFNWMVFHGYADFCAYSLQDVNAAKMLYRQAIYSRRSVMPFVAYMEFLMNNERDQNATYANVQWALSVLNGLSGKFDSSPGYVAAAYALRSTGRLTDAERILNIVEGKGLQIGYLFRCRAYLELDRNNRALADQLFSKALSSRSENPFTLRSSAAHLAVQGKYSSALTVLTQATTLDRSNAAAWELRAVLTYITDPNIASCLEFFDVSLKLVANPTVQRMKAQVLFEIGKVEEAKAILEGIVGQYKTDFASKVSLLLCLDALLKKESGKSRVVGSDDGAKSRNKARMRGLVTELERVLASSSYVGSDVIIPADAYYRLGMFYLNMEKRRSRSLAKQLLLKAGRNMHPLAVYMLGWIEETAGNIMEAEELYSRSLVMNPVDPIMLHKLYILANSTHAYVRNLYENSQTKGRHAAVKYKKLSRKASANNTPIIVTSFQNEQSTSLRLQVHERISIKLSSRADSADSQLRGNGGRAGIDPLWRLRFLYEFDCVDSWVWCDA